VGKSTAVQYLRACLEQYQIPCLVTREPGGTQIAERIRHLVLDNQAEAIHPDTELLLMFASRAQHIQQVILPALSKGLWVISDRFTDASFAYQGGGRGISDRRIQTLADWVQADLQPDLTLLLTAPVTVAFERIKKSRKQKDRIELETQAFFERVQTKYYERAEAEPQRFRLIRADESLDNVQHQLQQALKVLL
jgi:dTMP kinase